MNTYTTTTTHSVEALEVTVEVDDEQDISFLDESAGHINDPDPMVRMGARADAILRSLHGREWGLVTVVVRSQPDNVVRAVLGGVDARNSGAYQSYPGTVIYSPDAERRALAAADYFGEVLTELVAEARDSVREDIGDAADSLPVVDCLGGGGDDVTGADVRDMAATAIDWWTRA